MITMESPWWNGGLRPLSLLLDPRTKANFWPICLLRCRCCRWSVGTIPGETRYGSLRWRHRNYRNQILWYLEASAGLIPDSICPSPHPRCRACPWLPPRCPCWSGPQRPYLTSLPYVKTRISPTRTTSAACTSCQPRWAMCHTQRETQGDTAGPFQWLSDWCRLCDLNCSPEYYSIVATTNRLYLWIELLSQCLCWCIDLPPVLVHVVVYRCLRWLYKALFKTQ